MSYLHIYLYLCAHSGVQYELTLYVTWRVSFYKEASTAYPSRAAEFKPVFLVIRVVHLFSFLSCVVFCLRSVFCVPNIVCASELSLL